jgi:hypothetical protein
MQAALVMAALETISSRIKSESASILLFIRGLAPCFIAHQLLKQPVLQF